MVTRPLILSLSFVFVMGCGSTTDTDGGSPLPPENVLSCSQPAVCGLVSANTGDPGFPPPTDYTEPQMCALQELAKGKPARIAYVYGCEGMCYGEALLVRSDGSVIVQPFQDAFGDPGYDVGGIKVKFDSFADSQLCKLKPASYFNDCLSAFDNGCTGSSSWVTDCAKPAPAACEP
jgi:hypothetical protein